LIRSLSIAYFTPADRQLAPDATPLDKERETPEQKVGTHDKERGTTRKNLGDKERGTA
jgi:hypothetical protein